ncbi:hypothetical protein, conserved [Leishmania tarentolae]|uniref:Enkurin domain-containing protein n=1 Tax=Leishmania tarentolae TaxID=5689 RepID=A0A640K9Z2_LEITA|nr:hypothetical protein, conserved [Leishmania tarentolae]
MTTSEPSLLGKHRARTTWLEGSLDRSIAAYESHRNALENIYAHLETWQQSSGHGCIHVSPTALSALLKAIDDVLEQCALRLQPLDGVAAAADSPTEQARLEHRSAHAHLHPENAHETRHGKEVPASPQPQHQPASRSLSEKSKVSHSRRAEDNLHEASTMTTESRRHVRPERVFQHQPLSSSRSRESSMTPSTNQRGAASAQPACARSADSTSPPSQALAGSWKPQSRPHAQPRDRVGVALTPWPIIDGKNPGSGGAAGPEDDVQSVPAPPSARLRAEENHNELPASQYNSYKKTGRPLLPSPERRAAAEELKESAMAETKARVDDDYQQSLGARGHNRESDRNGAYAKHHRASLASSATSASYQRPPPQALQGEQRSQSYLSEEQGISYHWNSSAPGEHRSWSRADPFEEGRYGSLAPTITSGHRVAAVASQHSHPAPSHPQSSVSDRGRHQTFSTHRGSPPDEAVESFSNASSAAPRCPSQPRGGAAGATAVSAGHPAEASQAGSLGLICTPSLTPQRDSGNEEAVVAPQRLTERRRLRTYSQRPATPKNNDSRQVEAAVYHRRTLSPSAKQKPLRADSPETLRFMEKEDAYFEKQWQRARGQEHRDPLPRQNSTGATRYIKANPDSPPVANSGHTNKEEGPRMTAVEEQLMVERTILCTQLEKMQMETCIAVAQHREQGNEKRYSQLNTRMRRVMKDLDRVEWELRVVQNMDCQSRSKSAASGT